MSTQFQERFNVSSTTGKVSLFISPVTVGDDKAYGEFRCELIDSLSKTWKRAILLEVIGKFKSVAETNCAINCYSTLSSEPSLNAGRT